MAGRRHRGRPGRHRPRTFRLLDASVNRTGDAPRDRTRLSKQPPRVAVASGREVDVASRRRTARALRLTNATGDVLAAATFWSSRQQPRKPALVRAAFNSKCPGASISLLREGSRRWSR